MFGLKCEMWQEQKTQCEHLHRSTNSQKPAELAWESVSGSSLVGARRTHHVALLENEFQTEFSDVLLRSMEKRMRTLLNKAPDTAPRILEHPLPPASSWVPGTALRALGY